MKRGELINTTRAKDRVKKPESPMECEKFSYQFKLIFSIGPFLKGFFPIRGLCLLISYYFFFSSIGFDLCSVFQYEFILFCRK